MTDDKARRLQVPTRHPRSAKLRRVVTCAVAAICLAGCGTAATPAPAGSATPPETVQTPSVQTPDVGPASPVITEGAPSPTAPASTPSAAAGVAVSIVDFGFQPEIIRIHRGTSVTWTNYGSIAFSGLVMGNADHTVTFDDLGVGSDDLDHMDSYSLYFDKVGTYHYDCRIHDSMHGTVVVEP